MKRDVGFYVEADVATVSCAYLNAASHKPFERDCTQEPFYAFTFGVNFSMKYNMNGGSCCIRFMPCGTGTAVNMRFSLAQVAGARYERYAEDLNKALQAFLPIAPTPAKYNADDFLKPENQITPANLRQSAQPVFKEEFQAEPIAAAAQSTVLTANTETPNADVKFCANCGNKMEADHRFCTKCGTPVLQQKICSNCKIPVKENDAFCGNCGTHL